MTEHTEKLHQQLWNIANTLRGKMGADDFKDYILGLIFYKYLSERMEVFADGVLEPDGMTYQEVEAKPAGEAEPYLEAVKESALVDLGYFLEPSQLFRVLAERGDAGGADAFILDDLQQVLNGIEQSTQGTASEDDFGNLFEDLDLTSSKLGKTEADKNKLIVRVLAHLNDIDFRIEDTESDVLGDAYEYLIGEFASGAGKKAGEFYTPQQVSSILAKLVTTGKTQLESVYDPTCGSGSLLLRVAKEVEFVGRFCGQEMNPTTYNLCRMNLIMHNVHFSKFDIRNEDTLERPAHLEERFDAVVANPPFSANWSSSDLFLSDERFGRYGRLAPKTKADFAFVQHMYHQLKDGATMATVLPHGVLFRGAAEEAIRTHLIERENALDAVIGLPANIFYGTSIPTCIMVLKKGRAQRDVLFIDASAHFEKAKNQNHLRPADIDRIISTYRNRASEDKYSHLASIEEIRENEYNLNIPRYVDTFEEEEPVDLAAVARELKALDAEMAQLDAQIRDYCAQLGIESPF